MLHILLLLLKIAGILLAVILGIIVLLLCTVLFVPVTYRAEGHFDGEPSRAGVQAKVRWLFGLVGVTAVYDRQKLRYTIRLAWKTWKDSGEDPAPEQGADPFPPEKECVKDEENTAKTYMETDVDTSEEKEEDGSSSAEISETPEEGFAEGETIRTEKSGVPNVCEEDVEKSSQVCKEERTESSEAVASDDREDISESAAFTEKMHRSWEKITGSVRRIFEKIKCTRDRLCDKIKALSKKKDEVQAFIESETHKNALAQVKKQGLWLLGKIRPKRFSIDLEYGFDDPALTGQTLALISMIYPFIGGEIRVVPDFQNRMIDTTCAVSGGIRVAPFVRVLICLLLCKEVRQSYRDIKEFI